MKQKKSLITLLITMSVSACNSSQDEAFLKYIKQVKTRVVIDHIGRIQCTKETTFGYPVYQHRKSPFKKKMATSSGKQSYSADSHVERLKVVGFLKSKTKNWTLFAHKNGEITYRKLGEQPEVSYGEIIEIEKHR
ncbi:TPA: hypothetical protein ACPSKE_002190 [Legionella feeleii]